MWSARPVLRVLADTDVRRKQLGSRLGWMLIPFLCVLLAPLLSNDDTRPWIARIADGNFAATVLSLGGTGHGWLAIPRVSVPRSELLIAAAAVVAWLVVERGAPELLRVDALVHQSWGALAALLLALVDRHTKWALLLALAVVLLESARWLRSTGNTALRPSTTSLVRKRSSGP